MFRTILHTVLFNCFVTDGKRVEWPPNHDEVEPHQVIEDNNKDKTNGGNETNNSSSSTVVAVKEAGAKTIRNMANVYHNNYEVATPVKGDYWLTLCRIYCI